MMFKMVAVCITLVITEAQWSRFWPLRYSNARYASTSNYCARQRRRLALEYLSIRRGLIAANLVTR